MKTNKMNHSEGSWIWGEDYRGLYDKNHNEILVWVRYEGMFLNYHPQREDDAKLIESAPLLYKALVELLNFAETQDIWGEEITNARGLIKKLNG